MIGTKEYASSLKGVCLAAFDSWAQLRDNPPRVQEDADIRTGAMHAYSQVLFLATGRRVGTEEELVKEIIDSME